jgi:hypothetical protein
MSDVLESDALVCDLAKGESEDVRSTFALL